MSEWNMSRCNGLRRSRILRGRSTPRSHKMASMAIRSLVVSVNTQGYFTSFRDKLCHRHQAFSWTRESLATSDRRL